MQKSPCLECTIVGRDKDKRNNHCAQCEKRKAYVMSLGGLSTSVPMEMTDMGEKTTGRRRWTEDEIKFLKENVNSMTNKQMAGQLGRSVSSLSVKLSALHITRDGNAKFNELDNKDLDEFQEAESVGRRVKELLNSLKTPLQPGCNFLTIDFTNHGDLYDRFLSFVESEFRTPENEILFLISKVLRYHDDKDQI